jgi:hypothetical protein
VSWDDEALRERIKARAGALGRSVRSVLREAGLTLDFLAKTPAAGRRVDSLAKLGPPLQWNLQQVMGFEVAARVTPELMQQAFKVVRRALRYVPDAEEVEPLAIVVAYNALLGYRERGAQIDEQALAMLEESIAANFGFVKRG